MPKPPRICSRVRSKPGPVRTRPSPRCPGDHLPFLELANRRHPPTGRSRGPSWLHWRPQGSSRVLDRMSRVSLRCRFGGRMPETSAPGAWLALSCPAVFLIRRPDAVPSCRPHRRRDRVAVPGPAVACFGPGARWRRAAADGGDGGHPRRSRRHADRDAPGTGARVGHRRGPAAGERDHRRAAVPRGRGGGARGSALPHRRGELRGRGGGGDGAGGAGPVAAPGHHERGRPAGRTDPARRGEPADPRGRRRRAGCRGGRVAACAGAAFGRGDRSRPDDGARPALGGDRPVAHHPGRAGHQRAGAAARRDPQHRSGAGRRDPVGSGDPRLAAGPDDRTVAGSRIGGRAHPRGWQGLRVQGVRHRRGAERERADRRRDAQARISEP